MPRPNLEHPGTEFDWEWSFAFLAVRAVAGIEVATGRTYHRLIRDSGRPIEIRFAIRGGAIVLRATALVSPSARIALVRHWFDLDRDLRPFHRLAEGDRQLGPLVARRPGIRIPGRLDPFEIAVRAIVGQLISVAAATTILGRLVAAVSPPVETATIGLCRSFPTAAELAATNPRRISAAGLTRAKAEAIRALARAVCDGGVRFADLAALSGTEADRALRAQAGIGPWTAGYIRLRGLGDPDVSLETDLGIVKALAALGVPRRRCRAVVDRWRPWRSYAMLHLWASGPVFA